MPGWLGRYGWADKALYINIIHLAPLPPFRMSPFLDMVTLHAIAHLLIGLRLKDARKRHDRALLHNICDLAPSPDDVLASGAGDYLPPRRLWLRPHSAHRTGYSREEIARRAIWRAIRKAQQNGTILDMNWGQRLSGFVDEIRALIADCPEQPFSNPIINLIPKGRKKYRITASSRTLRDRVISGLLARYLESVVEPCLGTDCFSFRVNGATSHDAILRLNEYRAKYDAKKPLYVAECDLRGFYDGLTHRVAMESVRSAAAERGTTLDPVVDHLLSALLTTYSYPEYAYPAALEQISKFKRDGDLSSLSKSEMKRTYGSTNKSTIGIPQGNPVSPVLANAVLRKADYLMRERLGADSFYARYCDDIILIHPDKQICLEALTKYIHLMRELQLPVHKPVEVERYGADYYGLKSKKPFRWGEPKGKSRTVPWIQFVGYQINREGELRIRKESIVRQKAAVSEVFSRARHLIEVSMRKDVELKASAAMIHGSLAGRVIWSGTGQKKAPDLQLMGEPCWIDAYPLVEDNPHSRAQMRELDRHRESEFRAFRRWLKKMGITEIGDEVIDKDEKKPVFYYGAPYSYYGALKKTTKRYHRAADYG